jgi:predicted amidohydrolase
MAAGPGVAVVQMAFGRNVAKNLATMEAAIRRLGRRRVRLAVFPECCLSGYLVPPDRRDWPAIAAGIERLREAARKSRMALIFGTARPNGRKLPCNSVLAIDEKGRAVSHYDKLHLMPDDRHCFSPGRALPEVFRLAGLRVAMQICFDLRFPEAARLAALAGAELLTYSLAATGRGAWKKPVMEGHLRSRAAENGVFVAAANRFERVMMMNSRLVGPDGLDLAAAPYDRSCEILAELRPASAARSFLAARRGNLYSLKARVR